MKKNILLLACLFAVAAARAATAPEINVTLRMSADEYIEGEKIRAVVDLANGSPDTLIGGRDDAPDRLFLELFRASDSAAVDRNSYAPFTVPFVLKSSEGQKFEVFFDHHFPIASSTRYLARAVLVHEGSRYEGSLRSFDVVPGIRIGGALQMFANRPDLRREFELVYWNRDKLEHLFLKARDEGPEDRRWATADLGPILRVTQPKISIRPNGEVTVLHRTSQDEFVRSLFWSLPEAFEFQEHETLLDPEVAGAERVKALYQESSGVEPVKKAWWKFW